MYACSEASHEVRIGRDELKVRVDVGTKPLRPFLRVEVLAEALVL